MDQLLNEHIGRRLRMRRRALGLSQSELAERAGLRFRQIHKYECAENRTSSATLWRLACALEVNVHYFFEGLRTPKLAAPRQTQAPTSRPTPQQAERTVHAALF
jgi:transcriptional regulator with XRE-family HTH domain